MAPVNSNQLGTGKQIPCDVVEIVPTVTLLCGLLALHISARDLGSYQIIFLLRKIQEQQNYITMV